MRCFAHAGQKSLENAMRSVPQIQELIDTLVTKYAGKTDRGSLARALANSGKLRSKFKDEVNKDLSKIEELCEQRLADGAFSFAAHRWDSMIEVLRLTTLRISDIISFLCQVAHSKATQNDKDNALWAQRFSVACRHWQLRRLHAGKCSETLFSSSGVQVYSVSQVSTPYL